jgi:dipeptide/tripeptide permease
LAFLFFGAYALIITAKTRHLKSIINPIKKSHQFFGKTFSILIMDKTLFRFLMGGICVAITYSQFESTLPQYMYSNGLGNFSYAGLLMINAFGVLIFQIPISKIADKFELLSGMRNGGMLLFLGYLIIAISNANLAFMFLGMLIITFGELFISPVQNVVVNRLAATDTYGLYFGAYNLRQLGFSLGPLIGSYLLGIAGGTICFVSVAMFGMLASYFFGTVQNKLMPEEKLEECNNE